MISMKTSRPTIATFVAAALILAAGTAAVASNMGFKMNKPLVKISGLAGSQNGNNWTSIPYHNPYGTINGFCTQTGLISTGIPRTLITTKNYVTDTEGLKSYACGSTSPLPPALVPGKMLQIRQPAAGSDSIIIVGSHNSGQVITATEGLDLWFSVPYHTTWVTTDDLCLQTGLTSSGLQKAVITRLNPGPPAAFQTTLCASANRFNLVLGEGLQIREVNGTAGTRVVTFTPAHY